MSDVENSVKAIFLAAVDRGSPEERAAVLEERCGDDAALRRRVEALLRAHNQPGNVLGAPAAGPEATVIPADSPPPSSTVETIIAERYRLVERIGEGGMGEVWVAKQKEPVKRRVALKLIKTGMDSRAVLQRFEQERQALALMDHPNIAKVLDAGLTPTGQPFFVMELVNGLPLTKFCDQLKLTPKERLELFVPICQAVQHAHQKGIVHRDLKPSNILITMIDGKPVPKVIDFGVAKATSGKLTEETLSTQFGAMVGTLEYMSPEQAAFTGQDIDTRADIYSLGVILYELLTGLRPIDAKRLKEAALTEMIRIIREEEPAKPSTRLSTDASLPSLAASRQIEPRKLMALLRGELDWVVMKCLEKQRDRRYETANALSRDIQRYLADEEVEARPPSAGYRLSKFLRRNRGPVLAASVVLVSVVGGLTGVLAVQAKANRDLSVKNAELAKSQAAVEERFKLAKSAIKTFHTGVSEDFLLKQPEFKALRDQLLKSASDFYDKLGALLGQETDLLSRRELWQSNFELAELTAKVGEKQDALTAHQQVLAARESLAAENPDDAELKLDMGRSLIAMADLLFTTGKSAEAEGTYRKAEQLLVKLVPTNAADVSARTVLATCRSNLGSLLFETGRYDESPSVYRLARVDLELLAALPGANAETRRGLAEVTRRIGGLLLQLGGSLEAAEVEHSKSLSLYKKLVDDNPNVLSFQFDLARIYDNVGILQRNMGKPYEQAEAALREALRIRRKLAADNPAVIEFQSYLARSLDWLGWHAQQAGRNKEAMEYYIQDEAINKKLAQAGTGYDARGGLANIQVNMADILRKSGNLAEARILCEQAVKVNEELVKSDPNLLVPRRQLGESYFRLGQVHYDMKHLAEAAADWRKAIQQYAEFPVLNFERAFFRTCCHAGLAGLAGKPESGVSTEEGLAELENALVWLREAVKNFRNRDAYLNETGFDPIRKTPEFQSLMNDLARPARPIANGQSPTASTVRH